MANLTEDQSNYLLGLRSGDWNLAQLIIRDETTLKDDFGNFERFIKKYGHPDPEAADLFLSVPRLAFLQMLFYAADRSRDCLVLQNCFGFDSEPKKEDVNQGSQIPLPPVYELTQVGRIVLIQKGNFQQLAGQSDESLFLGDSVYRNQGKFELFMNMDVNRPLPVDQARQYIDNFLNIYPKERLAEKDNPVIHGFLLPVRPLINLFTSSTASLGRSDTLTFRWGITRFNEGFSLGNFSLAIGTGDVTSGQVIEFRATAIVGTGENDCPPNTGCSIPTTND